MPHAPDGSQRFSFHAHAVTRDVTRVWLGGAIARDDAQALDDLLRRAEAGAAIVILDVRAVTAIDGSVLHLIRAGDRRARNDGRRLVILRGPGPLGWALDELHVDARIMSIDGPAAARAGASRRLEVSAHERAGRAVIEAFGELDIATGPELATALAREAARRRSILLDLRGVAFMDCTGIGLLIQAFERARDEGLGFELIAGEAVDRTLESVGLRGHFRCDEGRATAAAAPQASS